MKFRVIDPNGLVHGGKLLPPDTEIDLGRGPHLDAALRFKQVEEVKEAAIAAPVIPPLVVLSPVISTATPSAAPAAESAVPPMQPQQVPAAAKPVPKKA